MKAVRSAVALVTVVAAHAAAITWALHQTPETPIKASEPPRLTASLIAPTPREALAPASHPTPTEPSPKPQRPTPAPPKPTPAPTPRPPAQVAPAPLPAQPSTAAPQSESRAVPAAASASAGEPGARTQTAASPQPARESEAIVPPHADASHLGNPAPRYPAISRKLGEEGEVQLKLLVKADGSVGEVQVRRSSGFTRLDQAALRAAQHWRFVPARQGATPIDYWYLQSVRFALDAA